MAKGRPEIPTPKGKTRPPKLRDDLKELRNRFFHYGHDVSGDVALKEAMTALAGEAASYELIEPVALFIHQVEAAWLHAHRGDVTVRRPGQPAMSLADLLEP
jgi:hypothetical protein